MGMGNKKRTPFWGILESEGVHGVVGFGGGEVILIADDCQE